MHTFPVPRRAGGPSIKYVLINDLPTLVWSANLANIEIHPFLHRVPDIERPEMIAFDLDPGEGADVLTCAEVAFLLKDVLDGLKLKSFAKVSGSKGIQVYVPLNTPITYAATQPFARAVAELLAKQHPNAIVSEMPRHLRKGKVFIDWSQNADFKTTVGVYSLRAKREHPYVSAPVTWEELRDSLELRDPKPLYFDPEAILERCQSSGDFFAPVLKLKQKLPENLARRLPGSPEVSSAKTPRSLEQYDAKRNFSKTPEPQANLPRRSSQGGRRRFVIQKHAASHLHYDFRLEMHDVLKSWAVPKGMSYSLDERRLAMSTEDHPIEYLDFEGTIPAGQYGGGTVMVWDIGTYELIEGNYYKGRLHIFLAGKKLKGEWILERDAGKGERAWVMRKEGKPIKPISPKRDDESALTGRTMQQIAQAGDRVWQSNRASSTASAPVNRAADLPDLDALPTADLKFVQPMFAKLVDSLPESAGWSYEIKLDGYRALALCSDDGVQLFSRNNNTLNGRFPTLAKALRTIEVGTILDGEVVALD